MAYVDDDGDEEASPATTLSPGELGYADLNVVASAPSEVGADAGAEGYVDNVVGVTASAPSELLRAPVSASSDSSADLDAGYVDEPTHDAGYDAGLRGNADLASHGLIESDTGYISSLSAARSDLASHGLIESDTGYISSLSAVRVSGTRDSPGARPAVRVVSRRASSSSNGSFNVAEVGGGSVAFIDWNARFLRILALPELDDVTVRDKYAELGSLARDFEAVASLVVRTIVEEANLPVQRQTIRPVASDVVGGIAGGEKYIHHGILFKVANDWAGLYGSDEAAGKAASHELQGAARVWSSGVRGIRVPMVSLLRYRGVRVLAMALVPIHPTETLVWGSRDAGKTAFNSDERCDSRMRALGKKLHLRAHKGGSRESATIVGPVDAEGHLARDGNFYLLDLARLMPPVPPHKKGAPAAPGPVTATPPGSGGLYSLRNTYLFQLMRSELVLESKEPLNSDTFAPFARVLPETERLRDERRVAETFEWMKSEKVPEVAREIDRLASGEGSVPNGPNLCGLLHRHGVNLRYLSLVLASVTSGEARRCILTEMIARACKSRLNGAWREEKRRTESEEAHAMISSFGFVQTASDFLNALLLPSTTSEMLVSRGVFGEPDSYRRKRFTDFQGYWTKGDLPGFVDPIRTLYHDLCMMFPGFRETWEELGASGAVANRLSARKIVDVPVAIGRACELASLRMDSSTVSSMQSAFGSNDDPDTAIVQLTPSDLEIFVGVKSMALVLLGDAVSLGAMARTGAATADMAMRLFERSRVKFEELLAQDHFNLLAQEQYGSLLIRRSMLDNVAAGECTELWEAARKCYRVLRDPERLEALAEVIVDMKPIVSKFSATPRRLQFRAHSFAAACLTEAREWRQALGDSIPLSVSSGSVHTSDSHDMGTQQVAMTTAVLCAEDILADPSCAGLDHDDDVNDELARWLADSVQYGNAVIELDPPPLERKELARMASGLGDALDSESTTLVVPEPLRKQIRALATLASQRPVSRAPQRSRGTVKQLRDN